MASHPGVFAILGDVRGSRTYADQMALFQAVESALAWVNETLGPGLLQPFQMTIGDEFQGVAGVLSDALRAVLLCQLRLAGHVRVRFGIGHGSVRTLTPGKGPWRQTGSAWWGARAAIESVEALQGPTEGRRTCGFVSVEPRLGGAVQAFLILRDRLLAEMDERDERIALGLAIGATQARVAADLGIDPAAVSRRKYRKGIDALLEAHDALADEAFTVETELRGSHEQQE